MLAETQYRMTSTDLEVVLAVVRARTLIEAGKRLGIDGSTVFRSVQKFEKGLGQRLFERSQSGSQPTELALQLAQHAERIESELDAARTIIQTRRDGLLAGIVRIATTDTILHGLVLPVLGELAKTQPLLQFGLTTGNEATSLAKRDTDIALRITRAPPGHLVGKLIGRVRMAVFGPQPSVAANFDLSKLSRCPWISPDDSLSSHPSVQWRKRHYPSITPSFKVNSILAVKDAVAAGLGIGLVPLFLVQPSDDLVQLSEPIEECETQLWLLIHAASRHIARVSTTYTHLANHLVLR